MTKTSFELVSDLSVSPDLVWQNVRRPSLFLHVAAPLVQFKPIGLPHFPEEWEERDYVGSMRLFGFIPIGDQIISISFPEVEPGTKVLVDSGHSRMLPVWNHRIEVTANESGTRYVDRIVFDAGWLTSVVLPGVKLFFHHRQNRLRALAAKGFADLEDR